MAQTLICIEKDDINTSKTGLHYTVKLQGGNELNFTPEALDELIKDYKALSSEPQTVGEPEPIAVKSAVEQSSDYKILANIAANSLEERVKEWMEKGYTPCGNVFVLLRDERIWFYQAMYKVGK